jgi:hypothetical protein
MALASEVLRQGCRVEEPAWIARKQFQQGELLWTQNGPSPTDHDTRPAGCGEQILEL